MNKINFAFYVICVFLSFSAKAIKPTYEQLMPSWSYELIHHTYYSLDYCEEHEQASFVFYRLTPDFFSDIERTEDFRPDPAVSTGSATLADYKGSGYDRGHLCPAADMKLNEVSISESFFMSNMSPQDPSFNRGIWSKLESLVRDWCLIHDSLYIATGPVFKDCKGTIGADSVTIPGYYYKAIIDGSKRKTIAFVLPNAKSSNELSSFVITVDSLETLTGIDFFAGLPDNIEKELESKVDFSRWTTKESSTGSAKFSFDEPKICPTTNNHFFHVEGAKEPMKISVYTTLGECIYQTDLMVGETTLDLSEIKRGIYLIRATIGTNTQLQQRIVKK